MYRDTFAIHMYLRKVILYIQPIPLGVTFSNAVSKLKAQSSNVSFHWNVAKETFELWALSLRKCHPKWNWLYLYITLYTHIYDIYVYTPYRRMNVSEMHMSKVVRWSDVTHMNESWHTGLGKCIVWTSHVTHVTAWFYMYIHAPW